MKFLALAISLTSGIVAHGATPGLDPIVYQGNETPGPVVPHRTVVVLERATPGFDWVQIRDEGDGRFLVTTGDHQRLTRATLAGRNGDDRVLVLTALHASRGRRWHLKLTSDGSATLSGWTEDGRPSLTLFAGRIEPDFALKVFERRYAEYPRAHRLGLSTAADACARWLSSLVQRSSRK